jgi:thioredoxin
MKKLAVILASIVVFITAGAIIIAWSVFQRQEAQPGGSLIVTLTDDNFQKEVVEASKTRPIVVDFYADWCFPCRLLEPVLEDVAREYKGRAVIGKVDTDKNLIARRFGVDRVPAIFIIKDAEIKDAFTGYVSKDRLLEALKKFGS